MGQTTIGGCKIRIKNIQYHIEQHKKYRGIGPGTYWLDVKAVDEGIAKYEKEIQELRKKIKTLESLSPNT